MRKRSVSVRLTSWIAVLALTQALSPGSLRAQEAQPEPTGQFSEIVEVELIEVDVLVTDKDGNPVLDLTPSEFKVLDDKQPVTLTHFAPPTASPAAGPGAIAPTLGTLPRPRQNFRQLVIFLDELRLNLRSRHLVLERLGEVLQKELTPDTRVLLASYTGTVDVLVPFTNDHKRVAKVLEERMKGAAQAVMIGVEKERALFGVQQVLEVQLEAFIEFGLDRQGYIDATCEGDVGGFARSYAQQVYGQVEAAIGALGQFLVSLAAYPGHKSLLYVSDGVPLVAGQDVWDFAIELCDGTALSNGSVSGRSIIAQFPPARRFPTTARSEIQQFNTHDDWSRLAAAANSRRVTLNTLQAAGLVASRAANVDGARTSFATETMARFNEQESLVTMAEQTGGQAILNTNDVAPAFAELIDAEASRYILAFPSSHPSNGESHRLVVEVDRPDVEVRHRKSYESTTPDQRVLDRVSASLFHGFEDNSHELGVVAKRDEEQRKKVVVEVDVPISSLVLLPDESGMRGVLTMFLAALDDRGRGTSVRRRSISVNRPAGQTGGIHQVQVAIDLDPSRDHLVAIAVRDELGGTASYVTTSVKGE
jgi:VWFA-related protein